MAGGAGGTGGQQPVLHSLALSVQPTTPGGPIQLTWELWSLFAPDAEVQAAFFFQGNRLGDSAYPAQSSSQKHGTGQQPVTILGQDVFPNDRQTKDALYAVGEHEIDMELRTKDGRLVTIAAGWLVVSDPAPADWWWWNRDKIPPFAYWNSLFTLAGHFHNDTFAEETWGPITINLYAMIGNNWVFQTSFKGPGMTNHPTTVAAAENSPILSWTNGVKWTWLNTFDYSVVGPLSMRWGWTVSQAAFDEFGNVRLQPDSEMLVLDIAVRSDKPDAAMTAQKLLIAAAALGWWNAIAGLIELSVAEYWGTIAQDPPAPDPAYRKAVALSRRKLPALPAGDPTLAAIGGLSQLSADIAAGHNALSTTEGRLLGARLAGNQAAVKLQARTYREVVRSMGKMADRIPDAVTAIVAAGKQDPRLSLTRQRRALAAWRRGRRVPATVRVMWRKAHLPLRALKRLDAAVRRGAGKEVGKEPVVDTLSRIGTLVAWSVVLAERRAPAVLAGAQPVNRTRETARTRRLPPHEGVYWVLKATSKAPKSGNKGRSLSRAQ